MMKKVLLFCFLLGMLTTFSCGSNKSASTNTVVKPKPHNRFYDRKADKHKKRTRTVRMKG